MSTLYLPQVSDRETVLYKWDAQPHSPWGTCVTYLYVGVPGTEKNNQVHKPLFHITGFDPTKTADDVVWAKLWLNVENLIGTPSDYQFRLARCTRYNWYEWAYDDPVGHTLYCDYTCYQHSGGAWSTAFGDFSGLEFTDFWGPTGYGFFSITITDLVKDAILSRGGDLNIGIISDIALSSTAFAFNCKHHSPSSEWEYVEVEWAAGGGATKTRVFMF